MTSALPPPPVIEWDHVTFAYGEAVAVEDVSPHHPCRRAGRNSGAKRQR